MRDNIPLIPKKRGEITLWQLVRYNLISENDIDMNGKVNDTIYQNALNRFNNEFNNEINNELNFETSNTNSRQNIEKTKRPLSSNHINNLRLMKQAINENRKIQEKENCCICLTNKISHILIPCYHLCCCHTCSNRINRCPKCRSQIFEKHKVYF